MISFRWRSISVISSDAVRLISVQKTLGFSTTQRGIDMNVQQTKAYYDTFNDTELCTCVYCRNYYREVRNAYPSLAEYLQRIGVNIEKPLEAMFLDPDEDGFIEYITVQYVVMGNPSGFQKAVVSGVQIDIEDSHPMTGVQEEHFVIGVWPIRLKWTEQPDC